MSLGDIVAIVTGIGAVVSAIAGVMLAIRAARSKERKATQAELAEVSGMLETERDQRVAAELDRHKLRVKLAQHGIDPDNGGVG